MPGERWREVDGGVSICSDGSSGRAAAAALFLAVAEELHFGRAAERLHMLQSPLSCAIRDLERGLGVVLFVRTTRRVELTPAVSALLERASRRLGFIPHTALRTGVPMRG